MPGKRVPISARLSPEDAEFIARLEIEGASTPSEKLRAIIVDARRREKGAADFPGAYKLAQDLVAPTLRIIRNSELEHDMHSELLSRLAEWLPECLAYLIAANQRERELVPEQLVRIERRLADRVFVLMQSVLQMGVTQRSPCYDRGVIEDELEPVLDLAEVIIANRQRKESRS